MSLCRLMIDDFENNSGYRIKDMRGRPRKYSRNNLLFGIEYSQDLLDCGYRIEPFLKYDLLKFIKWAKNKTLLSTWRYK